MAAQDFVDEHLLPRAPNGAWQFGLGFIKPYLNTAINNATNQYRQIMLIFGIIDEHGRIDLEKAHTAARASFNDNGGKVDFGFYKADVEDLDKLFDIARRHGEP